MGRRASSSLNAPAIIGIVVVVAVLTAGAALVLLRGKKDTFAAPPLPVEDIYSNANSMRGNEYTVQGKVDRREPRDSGLGVSILVDSGGEELPVFILVPDDVATINIDLDVSYVFKVRFGEGGVPVATGIKRL